MTWDCWQAAIFFGFAATQLPLGTWLDRYGPERVILYFLSLAVLGCLAFSMASSFTGLLAARVLVGVGISACLRALLTGFCRWFDASTLLRWALFCMASSVMGLAQPLVGMSFRPARAGHVSI